MVFEGILFDCYHTEEKIYLWVWTPNSIRCFVDVFYPSIYIAGTPAAEERFLRRVGEMGGFHCPPERIQKISFYDNQPRSVTKITLRYPSLMRRIYRKLYSFYEKLDIFHSDLEIPTAYLYSKNLFPWGRVRVRTDGVSPQVLEVVATESIRERDYALPPVRVLQMGFLKNHRIGISRDNPLVLADPSGFHEELWMADEQVLLHCLNSILQSQNPDLIVTSYGDQVVFPYLFQLAEKHRMNLALDREPQRIRRKIQPKGKTFESYGQVFFRASSYPLYGRLHIDTANSFLYKEAYLAGIVEIARISRMPIQNAARSSTGKALTNIEMNVAIRKNYLVPWQKAALERPKTVYELLRVDKGGLVTLPNRTEGGVWENVVQLDFAQMYPTIMSQYNISPETVNCTCCAGDSQKVLVPGTDYHLCQKRRGVVSVALEEILARRKHYKDKMAGLPKGNPQWLTYESRQNSLKWMLVTSFGYLGYRNAKFGRLESHESVTAIGREVLLIAKEMAEDRGYVFLHAMTDSLLLVKKDRTPFGMEELAELTTAVGERTQVQLKIEGIFDWLVFPGSKIDPKIGVVNRYFGKFQDGSLKVRGIFLRRKDIPSYIKQFQEEVLQSMQTCHTKKELVASRENLERIFDRYENRLRMGGVDPVDLLLRRTIGKNREDYKVQNASLQSLDSLVGEGMSVTAGEKIRYLVVYGPKNRKEYIPEEIVVTRAKKFRIHLQYYRSLLLQALEEVSESFIPHYIFRGMMDRQRYLPFADTVLRCQ